jgi:DNA polymerase-1
VHKKAHIQEGHLPTGLKPQSYRHVDKSSMDAQAELDEAVKRLGWANIPINFPPYWIYGALDPVLTAHLDEVHDQDLPAEAFSIENAVIWPLMDMSSRGVRVDLDYAREKNDAFLRHCDELRQWVHAEYGVGIGSNMGIIKVLQAEGYEFSKITESGALSLDAEVLGDIDHPLARTVLRHRKLTKLSSTYLEFYLQNAIDGLIHPSINSVGARTSRMSMSEPNCQNLPRSSEHNRAATIIRNCFIPRPGHVLLFCDFDQIEMRGLAHMSQDSGLITAFNSPEDFFVTLARSVFHDPGINSKKDPRRQIVKGVGYGKVYGAGVAKQAQTAGVSYQFAAEANEAFDLAFPGVARFISEVAQEANHNRMVYGSAFTTCPLTGRKHHADRGKEYALVNYKVQGWAAAIFKQKILELANTPLGEWMILPVHDEIILDVPEERVDFAVKVLRQVMNDQSYLVPISAGVAYGTRWGEKKDYE